MKKYIDFNTKKKMNATNDSEKDFFKLMINYVYGKTMKNLRKRMNVRLVKNEKDFLKYSILIFNKPTYIGFTVLDLKKWLMYDFRYNFIENNFDAELLFTDTDSLIYEIK